MILHGTLNNYDINIKKGHQIDDKIGYLRSTVSLQKPTFMSNFNLHRVCCNKIKH